MRRTVLASLLLLGLGSGCGSEEASPISPTFATWAEFLLAAAKTEITSGDLKTFRAVLADFSQAEWAPDLYRKAPGGMLATGSAIVEEPDMAVVMERLESHAAYRELLKKHGWSVREATMKGMAVRLALLRLDEEIMRGFELGAEGKSPHPGPPGDSAPQWVITVSRQMLETLHSMPDATLEVVRSQREELGWALADANRDLGVPWDPPPTVGSPATNETAADDRSSPE